MQSKSDALIVVPTMLNSIKAFHIFNKFWILADSLYLYQMSKNAIKIHNKLDIENTMHIYRNNDYLIVQAKDGWIYVINSEFIIQKKFHLNIFSFCKLQIIDQCIYSINSNQLEARNFVSEEIKYYNYQTEVFCSSIKVLYENGVQYIILAMDNGIIDVLKDDSKYESYNLVIDKQNPIFVYDVCAKFDGQLVIIAATNNNKIFVLKGQKEQQIIQLTFSPTSVVFFDKLNPLIALNKDTISLVTNKEICKFNFTNLTNYFYEKLMYLSTNEQIVIIDFNLLKK